MSDHDQTLEHQEGEVLDFDQARHEGAETGLPAVARPMAPVTAAQPRTDAASLLAVALEKGLPIETLERFIALKNSEEARMAKSLFDENFARMQSALKPVKKSKTAKQDGKDLYDYAPIEDLLRENGPIIASHGFSWKWKEESIEGNQARRYTILISGFGHTEGVSFDIPTIQGTKLMNPAQIAATMSTYGRRYTLLLGFGITVEDEDQDAHLFTYETGLKYGMAVQAIREAKTVEELMAVYQPALKSADEDGKKLLAREKNARMATLRKAAEAGSQ